MGGALAALAPASASAQREDPALRIARVITQRVARFENRRLGHPFGRWEEHPRAVWSIRSSAACLAELRQLGVPHQAWRRFPDPVPTPVKIVGAIDGVTFRKRRIGSPLFVSCEMAVRMPAIAQIVRRHGVHTVDVLSAYRREPPQSFHVMGLGLDLSAFHRAGDTLDVERDWVITPNVETCAAPLPATPAGRALRDIACSLAATRRFSSVLTPNYDEGHYNHFHLDARPDDPRFFTL